MPFSLLTKQALQQVHLLSIPVLYLRNIMLLMQKLDKL